MIGLDRYINWNNKSSGRQFNEQLEQVSQYITYKGLGRNLKKKILDYYQLKYSRGKYFDESKILAELNHPLRLSIYMRECRALIIQVPFFKGASSGFISQVVMILRPVHFLPEDLVIEKGTAGDQMFFIATGYLEVVIDGGKVVGQLGPGQFFGEIAMLFGHMKRTATIRARSACSLYSLSRMELNLVLDVYPEMAEQLKRTAEERMIQDLNRKAELDKKLKEEDEKKKLQ
jgi:CRP-like cAMP-binding protein